MSWKPLHKDLTETASRCHFCPNKLSSLTAYVLEHVDTGQTVYAGPICAANNIGDGYTLKGLPDLTRYTLPLGEHEGAGGGGGQGGNKQEVNEALQRAMEYLLLREHKLVGEMKTSYKVLSAYYQKSKREALQEADVNHINNLEAHAPEKLRLKPLQKAYNYLFWIDVALVRLEDKEFLMSVRSQLVTKLSISEGQRVAVNKWLQNIDGVPQLR